MSEQRDAVERIIDDLQFVKKAIARNTNVLKFMALSEVIRAVGLVTGLLITGFSGAFYLLIRRFGSFASIPAGTRALMIAAVVVLTLVLGAYKVVGVMKSARRIRGDYNMVRLIGEIYSAQTLLILIPFFVTIMGTAIFLDTKGLEGYIVPALALLFGLMLNVLVNVFHLRELMVGGDWLIGTGLLVLFVGEHWHPLLALIGTFGIGFISISAASLVIARAERKNSRG